MQNAVFRHIKGMINFSNRRWYYQNLRRLAKENAPQGELLSVMEDVVFKAIFTSDTEDSREALRSLLAACTRRPVSNVQVTHNDLIPAHLDAKAVRLDVHVIFNDGESADLEMQTSRTNDDLKVRAEINTAMLLSGQSKKGRSYKDIKQVYQIFFLNCVLFPQSGKMPRRYSYMEQTEHDRLSEITEIIFYELPKLERQVQGILAGLSDIKTDCLSEEEKWCMYMRYRHEKRAAKLIEKLYREEEGIMRAERTVKRMNRDYLKFAREMAIEKNRLDRGQMIYDLQQEARAQGLEDGLSKGLADGRAEGIIEIARKMKEMRLPITQITEVTGLSAEVIEKLGRVQV